ncbi:hypothetical protein C9F11_25195 [Streptomyces sp. YIM 121038]|nr:hypothetical protein C9F11_25195 [Streptomyces sp. YIM 121038]
MAGRGWGPWPGSARAHSRGSAALPDLPGRGRLSWPGRVGSGGDSDRPRCGASGGRQLPLGGGARAVGWGVAAATSGEGGWRPPWGCDHSRGGTVRLPGAGACIPLRAPPISGWRGGGSPTRPPGTPWPCRAGPRRGALPPRAPVPPLPRQPSPPTHPNHPGLARPGPDATRHHPVGPCRRYRGGLSHPPTRNSPASPAEAPGTVPRTQHPGGGGRRAHPAAPNSDSAPVGNRPAGRDGWAQPPAPSNRSAEARQGEAGPDGGRRAEPCRAGAGGWDQPRGATPGHKVRPRQVGQAP